MPRSLLRQAFTLCLITGAGAASAQSVGINLSGAAPAAAAMLDIDATGATPRMGVLIPRMTQAQREAVPVTAADDGLWVFQTNNTSGLYYYEQGFGWKRWGTGAGWALEGNNILDPTAQFLGTLATGTANKSFVLRSVSPATANSEMMILGTGASTAAAAPTTGYVSLSAANGGVPPAERLDVAGAIRVGVAAGANEGAIQYTSIPGDDPNNWHYGHDGTRWRRMENAENVVTSTPTSTPAAPIYARDTMTCQGATGLVMTKPELTTSNAGTPPAIPLNGTTPFITAQDPAVGATPVRAIRTQYLYRSALLQASGMCAGPITSVGFYLIDSEPLSVNPAQQTYVSGTVRIYVTPGAYTFGATMDASGTATLIRDSPFVYRITETPGLILSEGWIDFPVPDNNGNYATWAPGQDIVVDITLNRNSFAGISPRVDVRTDHGYASCRWIYQKRGANTPPTARVTFNTAHPFTHNLRDNPISPNVSPLTEVVFGGTPQMLATARFNANVTSPTVVPRNANFTQYPGGLMVGTQAWANTPGTFKGPGTIRAQNGVYDGNTQLSDHVFDRYYDGVVRPEDAASAADYHMVPLDDLRQTLERDRHLPDMPSRQEWEQAGTPSLGQLQTGLWRTVETQALYITELEKDLSALEAAAFGATTSEAETERLIAEVQRSNRLSDAQKLHLVAALRHRSPAIPTSK